MEVNSILTGVLNKTYDSPCLTVAQSSFVKVTFEEPVPWTRDGEDGGAHRTLTLRSHRHAVDILQSPFSAFIMRSYESYFLRLANFAVLWEMHPSE